MASSLGKCQKSALSRCFSTICHHFGRDTDATSQDEYREGAKPLQGANQIVPSNLKNIELESYNGKPTQTKA